LPGLYEDTEVAPNHKTGGFSGEIVSSQVITHTNMEKNFFSSGTDVMSNINWLIMYVMIIQI